jgi:hypothetical protein
MADWIKEFNASGTSRDFLVDPAGCHAYSQQYMVFKPNSPAGATAKKVRGHGKVPMIG